MWACREKTGEETFRASNASAERPVERVVRVAFCRANVGRAFRGCKSELGFTHVEGRNHVALRRHLVLCVAMMAFVAGHTQRLRGKNSQVTAEQVCRALKHLSRIWLAQVRETDERTCVLETIAYHQRRNRAATQSKRKRNV